MRKIIVSSVIVISCIIPAFATDAPDFNTFYALYKTASQENDITITGDIVSTRLISAPGATTTRINGGQFDFNGNSMIGFILSSGNNLDISNVGAFTTDGNQVNITKSFNTFSNSSEGGVISNLGGNVTINNSAFSNNSSVLGGGVIYLNNNATVTATDSVFSNNHATRGDGGVIYNEYETVSTFSNAQFTSNSASDMGGVAFNDGEININNSVFTSNTATSGGALYNSNIINIDGATFTSNTSDDIGGAIYTTGTLNLTNATFENNTSDTGGGIGNYGISGDTLYAVVRNSEFNNNRATYGGAIYNWDDMYVIDSNFINNSATDSGGAIMNMYELYLIANNDDMLFSGNTSGGKSNAIQSSGTIGMNAAENRTITFDDNIAGDGEIIINRQFIFNESNVPTGGTIVLNNDMTGFTGNVTMYNGNVNVTTNGKFFHANRLDVIGGTLNLGTTSANVTSANFATGATLGITIANENTYGNLTARDWNISDGARMNVILEPNALGTNSSMRVQILRGNAVQDNFVPDINNNIYSFIGLGDGWYEIAQYSNFNNIIREYGGTENNLNTASAWQNEPDTNGMERVIYTRMNELLQTNAIEYIHALTALAPVTAPIMQIIGTTLNDRFDLLTNNVATRNTVKHSDNGTLWMSGFTGGGQLDATMHYAEFNINGYGGAIGAEYQNHDLTLGIAYTYQNDDLSSWSRTINSPTHGGGIYATYNHGGITLRAKATGFYSDASEVKHVAGLNIYNEIPLYTFGAWMDAGYSFDTSGISITPRAGARYVKIHRQSSTDTATQVISSGNMDFVTAYGDITFRIKNINIFGTAIIPEFIIGTAYDLHGNSDNVNVKINDTEYNITSAQLPRWQTKIGAVVRVLFTPNTEIQIGCDGEFREGYYDYTVGARGILKF